jgi:N-6 DNA Methylase
MQLSFGDSLVSRDVRQTLTRDQLCLQVLRCRSKVTSHGVEDGLDAMMGTNLLFFTKGRRTERVWYYDLANLKVNKSTPFTLDKLDDFFQLLPDRADGERSWSVSRSEIEAKNYDLKRVNPNRKLDEDTRTPEELLDLIEAKGREVAEAIAELRRLGNGR